MIKNRKRVFVCFCLVFINRCVIWLQPHINASFTQWLENLQKHSLADTLMRLAGFQPHSPTLLVWRHPWKSHLFTLPIGLSTVENNYKYQCLSKSLRCNWPNRSRICLCAPPMERGRNRKKLAFAEYLLFLSFFIIPCELVILPRSLNA